MRIIEDRVGYKKVEFDTFEEMKTEAKQVCCVYGDELEITVNKDDYIAVITNWHQNGPRWGGYVKKEVT